MATRTPTQDPDRAKVERSGPLRILLIYGRFRFWSMGEGKGAASFSRMLEGLAARGHDVHVSMPANVGDASSVSREFGCTLHRAETSRSFLPRASLPLPQRLWERFQCWRLYRPWARERAREVARQHPPDLVIGLGSYESIPARWVAEQLGVPNVTRIFGVYAPPSRLKYYANFPEIAAFKNPTDLFVITNDGSGGDRLAKRLGVPPEKLYSLRNGFDLERFSPGTPSRDLRESLGIGPEQPLIVSIGRLAAEKKLERSLALLPKLLERHPGAVMALVGDGDQREPLIDLAKAMGLSERVRFPGALTREELPEWYRTADVFLSLLDRTNAANPTLEALASGCAIVALNTGSTSELLTHDENAVLVEPNELSDLADTLADLLDDPARRNRLGAAAAAHARQVLVSPQERLDFEVDLYEALARGESLPRDAGR